MAYIAYVLDEKSKMEIFRRFPSKFPDIYNHHVTIQFGVSTDTKIDQYDPLVTVIGYAYDNSLEALIVNVDGNPIRKDGKKYHITLSLDRSKGRKPVDSNQLVNSVKTNDVLVTPFIVTGTIQLLN